MEQAITLTGVVDNISLDGSFRVTFQANEGWAGLLTVGGMAGKQLTVTLGAKLSVAVLVND
jgi:hypothetical protein